MPGSLHVRAKRCRVSGGPVIFGASAFLAINCIYYSHHLNGAFDNSYYTSSAESA